MSESLQHHYYHQDSKTMLGGNVFTPLDQLHELAADISRYGAAALASEVQVDYLLDTPPPTWGR